MAGPILDPRLFSHPRADELPRLLLIGVDHRSAPLELREKVAYGKEESEALLARLTATQEIAEACLLSTCNRSELYVLPRDDGRAYHTGFQLAFLERAPEIESEGRFYVKRHEEAARHLLEVASGLQSMVLGEPEILGQVKQAAAIAEAAGSSGAVLDRLLRTAIAAGGRSRAETAIGAGAVSFGYAIVDLATSIFQSLEGCSVLMVGAGDMARQVGRSLVERGARELVVTNRSRERAEELAALFDGARVVPFEERGRAVAASDLVVATTAAEGIIARRDLDSAMRSRRGRPLLVVDLGVPRNVETAAAGLENLFLHDVDSLDSLISRNLKRRRDEVPRVEEILDRELERFSAWYRSLAAEPVIARLQRRAEAIRRQELAAVLARFPAETHEELHRLTRSLVKKLLHHPSRKLRSAGHDFRKIEVVRHLFQLDDEDDAPHD